MSSESDIRVRRRSGYTSVPNSVMADTRLSIEARGLIALLMTFKEGWVFRVSHIQKQCGVGREKYYRMINELKSAGYISITKTKGKSGKFEGADWEIFDHPEDQPCAGNPTSVEPYYGKPDHIRETNSVRENNNKNPHTPKGDVLFSADEMGEDVDPVDETEKLIAEGFREWWDEIWPRHERKKGKADCEKLYRKICLGQFSKSDAISPAELNRATRAYIASVKDLQYLKGPLPWLRQPGFEPFLGQPEVEQISAERARYRRIVNGGGVDRGA